MKVQKSSCINALHLQESFVPSHGMAWLGRTEWFELILTLACRCIHAYNECCLPGRVSSVRPSDILSAFPCTGISHGHRVRITFEPIVSAHGNAAHPSHILDFLWIDTKSARRYPVEISSDNLLEGLSSNTSQDLLYAPSYATT